MFPSVSAVTVSAAEECGCVYLQKHNALSLYFGVFTVCFGRDGHFRGAMQACMSAAFTNMDSFQCIDDMAKKNMRFVNCSFEYLLEHFRLLPKSKQSSNLTPVQIWLSNFHLQLSIILTFLLNLTLLYFTLRSIHTWTQVLGSVECFVQRCLPGTGSG